MWFKTCMFGIFLYKFIKILLDSLYKLLSKVARWIYRTWWVIYMNSEISCTIGSYFTHLHKQIHKIRVIYIVLMTITWMKIAKISLPSPLSIMPHWSLAFPSIENVLCLDWQTSVGDFSTLSLSIQLTQDLLATPKYRYSQHLNIQVSIIEYRNIMCISVHRMWRRSHKS
jgi:hypothetical protein